MTIFAICEKTFVENRVTIQQDARPSLLLYVSTGKCRFRQEHEPAMAVSGVLPHTILLQTAVIAADTDLFWKWGDLVSLHLAMS